MRCPLCSRIIGDTYDAIALHFHHKHPGCRMDSYPRLYDEAERYRMEQSHDAATRRLRKRHRNPLKWREVAVS